jgi:hypothetical protein
MPFQVACPNCGNRLNVKDEWVGKRLKCPKCAAVFPAARPAQAAAAVQRSRVHELAVDDEIRESKYSLPFRFGPDDRYPRLLYWAFMLYFLLDSIFAIPIFVSLMRDPSNQCVECLVGRASAIVAPLGIGVCIFVAYSMATIMYAGWKLLFVGVVLTGALGSQMDGQEVNADSVVLQSIWHAIGLVLSLWYFMARRE